jgi:NmrA-like family
MMIDLAREFGVSVFIYSSIQIVQNSFDDSNYKCEFFAGKLAVERYIQSLDHKGLGWMYVNTEHDGAYALLIALVVELSALASPWGLLRANPHPTSLDCSPRV